MGARKYDADTHPLIARGMAIQGATVADIAAGLGVGERTVNEWMSKHAEFAEAVTLGRQNADARVITSLYLKAIGGDTTACIFWLKNRKPAEWRDRQEIKQEASVTVSNSETSAVADRFRVQLARREQTARERMAAGEVLDAEQLDKLPLIEQCVWYAVMNNIEPELVVAYVYQEHKMEEHYAVKFAGLH